VCAGPLPRRERRERVLGHEYVTTPNAARRPRVARTVTPEDDTE
jgi:hypothetical protein